MIFSYYVLSRLIVAILLQSDVKGNNTADIPNQLHSIVEVSDDVCTTFVCNETAKQILNNIDEDVDPCDNFYKFSCGGFINRTSIPDNQSSVNAFWTIRNKILKQLRNIIEEPNSPDVPRYVRTVKNYYKSCINEAVIEKRGLTPLQKKMEDLGGWPVLVGEQWNDNGFDWLELSYKFHEAGFSNGYFMSLSLGTDLKDSTKQVLKFGEPYLGVSRDRMIEGMNNTRVRNYYELMVDVAVIFGASRDDAIVEFEESLKFEIELAKIMLPESEFNDQIRFYNPMTINQLSTLYPSIPWKEYINKIIASHFIVNNDDIVIVTVPEFIPQFIDLINKTPKRVQSNYALWKLVGDSAGFLNKNIRTRLSKYLMGLTGIVESQPLWLDCVEEISKFIAVHSLYVKKYFNSAAKNDSMEIVSSIIDQLKQILQKIDWMDDETRKHALEKAAAISIYVGYPDQLLNETLLEKYYENIDFNEDTLFENEFTFVRSMINDSYNKFREPIEKNVWNEHAATAIVNAFYDKKTNSIDFPAGILQDIFFDVNRPRYMNYGAIGSFIGHELTHAFDDKGRQYDKSGNLKNWWTTVTDERFHQKVQCIINQYSNYTVEEVEKKLNGLNTQSENIADNGGFKIAYLAYRNWSKKHGKEKTLPGLKYNPQQLFWLSAANAWCSKSRKEFLEIKVTDDSHSPSEFRILGSFRNLPEFAADFNCPMGSKMNPKDKCTFW